MWYLPGRDGWKVCIVTEEIGRSGRPVEREKLTTVSRENAEKTAKELEAQGYKVKIYECIF